MIDRIDEFLVIENLTVTFSRWGQIVHALDSVSFSVPRSQWVVLVGPNGSGKSTLLNVINSRLRPSAGNVFLEGKISSNGNNEIAQRVFQIHQDPLLGTAPDLTILENLIAADYEAERNHASRQNMKKKYLELLSPLGLHDRLNQQVLRLSGGERQLLALLIARLRPASLILLDEPLAALDPVKADMCLNQISELNKMGKTIIQVTHEPELATNLGNRTIALQAGRIVYDQLGTARSESHLPMIWSDVIKA